MSIELYQDAILTVDLPAEGLQAGDVGTVVERHNLPGRETGYSVEFFDMTGTTVAVVTEVLVVNEVSGQSSCVQLPA